MRCRTLLLCVALLGAGATGGCSSTDACAGPVTGTATYASGSTPPPYHVEWTVSLEASSGTVTFSPGYGSPLSWSAEFTPDTAQVAAACRRLRALPDSRTPIGGGTLTVRWRGRGGRTTSLRTADQQAPALVRAAVPASAWAQAEGGYERWQQTQRR